MLIVFPQSLRCCGIGAFSQCPSLEVVGFGGVPELSGCAFEECQALKEVALPSGLRIVNQCAFAGASALEAVFVPSSVVKICDCAFSDCVSMIQCRLSQALEEIGQGAFVGCRRLQSIGLPKTVRVIGHGAFNDCASLRGVNLPPALSVFPNEVFEGCELEVVVLEFDVQRLMELFSNPFSPIGVIVDRSGASNRFEASNPHDREGLYVGDDWSDDEIGASWERRRVPEVCPVRTSLPRKFPAARRVVGCGYSGCLLPRESGGWAWDICCHAADQAESVNFLVIPDSGRRFYCRENVILWPSIFAEHVEEIALAAIRVGPAAVEDLHLVGLSSLAFLDE